MDRLQGVAVDNGQLPFVLSIAGLDPTGGAGLLADIKTFQRLGVYGLGIITANTIQTDERLLRIDWQSDNAISDAIKRLNERFNIAGVKIGILPGRKTLKKILGQLRTVAPETKIVWDPVVKASEGTRFFQLDAADLSGENAVEWKGLLQQCTVITPNAHEAIVLSRLLGLCSGRSPATDTVSLTPFMHQISRYTSVLLKGGHLSGKSNDHYDRLYPRNCPRDGIKVFCGLRSEARQAGIFDKHGSGCVHSSAVTAMLARQMPLEEAAAESKNFMDRFLFANRGKLGIHR